MIRTTMLAAKAALVYAVFFSQPAVSQCVQPAARQSMMIEVHLPADAKLEIGGYATISVGSRRLFASPAVPVGHRYSYVVKAMWQGKTVVREVTGSAGETVAIQFGAADFHAIAHENKKDGTGINSGVPTRDGFYTHQHDGRWWVFKEGSKELASFKKLGEPDKSVTRVNAAPYKVTLRAPNLATLEEYLTAKLGFVTRFDDGRIWVFRNGSKELAAFVKDGELAKQVVRPGAGPRGLTLKAPDRETIDDYLKTN